MYLDYLLSIYSSLRANIYLYLRTTSFNVTTILLTSPLICLRRFYIPRVPRVCFYIPRVPRVFLCGSRVFSCVFIFRQLIISFCLIFLINTIFFRIPQWTNYSLSTCRYCIFDIYSQAPALTELQPMKTIRSAEVLLWFYYTELPATMVMSLV
jgi:hypothetical protein